MFLKRNIVWLVFGLLMLGILLNISVPVSAQGDAVNYSLSITDPSGDSDTMIGSNAQTWKDGDILEITSAASGNDIVLTMEVDGIIRLEEKYSYVTGYSFMIDIDGDGDLDWTITSMNQAYGNNTMMINDEETEAIYLPNSTGNNTDTLKVQFPISTITDIEPIYSWNLYATSSVSDTATSTIAMDSAPDDEEFPKDEGDNDGDGMPNWYEAEENLDPNNASDADADADEDGYTNKQEYDAGTDPWDKYDKPGAAELSVTIINPKEGGTIPPGGINDYYTINGTAAAKTGDPINHIEYRVVEAMENDWEWVDDDSELGDYSVWHVDRETYTVYGICAYWDKGKNTVEVKAFSESGENKTDSVVVYFNSDEPTGDSDEDGMPDDYEDDNGFNKNDPKDSSEDADGDGFSNLQEYLGETDPNDKNDYPGSGSEGEAESESEAESEGEVEDPSTETPTDTSLDVSITTSTWNYEKKGDYLHVDITVKGTTSGVDHCKLYTITYFDDGSKEYDDMWMEKYDNDGFKWEDTEFTYYHFKDTSAGWKTWEYRMKGSSKLSNDTSEDDRKPTKVDVYARAFSDATEDNWNQASKTSTVKIEGLGDGDSDDDDGGGFLPGFEALTLISAVGALLILTLISRRKQW